MIAAFEDRRIHLESHAQDFGGIYAADLLRARFPSQQGNFDLKSPAFKLFG